jgi:hypothetical protein
MLFGLSTAPLHFHRIMRQIVRFLRAIGVRLINYLDDFLFAERREKVDDLVELIKFLLPCLGLRFNKKCVWQPKQEVNFLGLLVNSQKFEVRVSAEKMQNLTDLSASLLETAKLNRPVPIDTLRSLTGKLLSVSLAIPAVKVWTRALFSCIARAGPCDELVHLDRDARAELTFWTERITALNGCPIAAPGHQLVAHADAGSTGWGFWLNELDAFGVLPKEFIGESSTARELVAVILGFERLKSRLRGQRVLLQMDSFAAVRNIVKGGGPVSRLSSLQRKRSNSSSRNMAR